MDFQDSIRQLLQDDYASQHSIDDNDRSRLCQKMIRHLQTLTFSSDADQVPKKGGDDFFSDEYDVDENKDNSFLKTRNKEKSSGTTATLAGAPNLRSILGNLSLDEISSFSNLLTAGISDRLDAEAFLPATQDEAANAAAMEGPAAQKLPRQALQTAQLYVQLLQRPGGWGAGFVQTSALTALGALLKRWRVEIQDTVNTKGSKKSSNDDDEPMIVDSEDGDDSENNTSLSPQELLMLGLDLGLEVARLPLHPEFLIWSFECREAVIEAVSSILGTSAAIVTPSKRSSVDTSAMVIAQSIVRQANESLADCLLMDCTLEDEGDSETVSGGKLSKLHETLVCICRGLYQLLTWKEILPFGEAGKQAASTAAAAVLEVLIEGLSENLSIFQHSRSPLRSVGTTALNGDVIVSPGRRTPAKPNVTPKTNRRVRLSIAGSHKKEAVAMTSPKLKSTARRACATTALKNKNRPIFSALLGLLQKIMTDITLEKASVRNSIIPSIHKCVGSLRISERRHFLQFLIQACHSRVSVHRLVACEIIGRILSEVWLWTEHAGQMLRSPSGHVDSAVSRKSLSPLVITSERDMPTALFGALQGRLSDRVPTVRGASISALASLLKGVREAKMTSSGASVSSMGLSEILNTEVYDLLELLRVRATSDDRATVRRYAVMALAELFLWSDSELTEYDLALLRDRCQDSSTMTRKAAAEALTALVESHGCYLDQAIQRTWISAVLPLCLDSDGSCATTCVDFAQHLMLSPLLREEQEGEGGRAVKKAWSILAKVGDGSGKQGASRNESEAVKVAIAKLLENASDPGRTKLDIMRLIHRVATSTLEEYSGFDPDVETKRTGIWCLFDAFVRSFKETSSLFQLFKKKSVDVSFLALAWFHMLNMSLRPHIGTVERQRLRGCVRKALYVLAAASRALDEESVMKVKGRLQKMLCNFDLPEDTIGSAVAALTSVVLALAPIGDVEAAQGACKLWILEAFDSCENKLAGVIGSYISPEEMIEVSRSLYVVGECALVGFNSSEDGPATKKEAASLSSKEFQSKGMIGLHVKPPAKLVDLVLSFLSENLAGSDGVCLPESVRAFAFLALGKICLRDITLAKRTLTVFARELHENMTKGSSVIQCNVLLIMGDLCIKYTSLADRYLPVMAACLQSGAVDLSTNVLDSPSHIGCGGFEVVRKSAIILLSSLIMQDYIKWRGLMFHRFLVATVDENEEVAELAENTLSGPLLVKTPKLFFNHFVEAFFVLNRCTAHPMYVAAASNGDGGSGIAVGFDGIDLSGEAGRVRRLKMYELMLSKMSDDEKISVTAKLAKEVLKSALVEGSDLHKACSKSSGISSSAFLVLSDTLAVLRSESIRVGKKSASTSEDIEDPNIDGTSKKIVEAKSRLMSKISRKQLIEIIVPILCNIKVLLQQNCSPLLKDLMAYLVDVYSSCKNEVQEVLMNDPTLLQEIEYDARQHKKGSKSFANQVTPTVVEAAS
eukprot:scaffold2576_cov175-Amphora_coffeaeformis.AAC.12